ncbi:hypothetical protein [Amycolatopsis japonica]|uniref:hypothetical protein n=1 Tax=Amycolatopsis japonica TaxID=208439 RepID=UPI0033D2DF1B
MTTSEVAAATTDLYASDFKAVEFIGLTNQAVFAAAAEWLGPRERSTIIRAVTFAPSARTDEMDCALTVIYEPVEAQLGSPPTVAGRGEHWAGSA